MTSEQWRPVTQFEGLYEVSDRGRVRSLTRRIVGSDGVARKRNGGLIKPKMDPEGRLQVSLSRNGERSVRRVHRLVLESFVGLRPEGLEGCHNDGNHHNNSLENLRWDTRSSNGHDRVRHGTHPQSRKTHCPAGHPYSGDNLEVLLVRGRGPQRRCRTCVRTRSRARSRRAYVPHPRAPRLKETRNAPTKEKS